MQPLYMLRVLEMVIKRAQEKIISFLWKNKNDRMKGSVIYQSLTSGGLNFPNIGRKNGFTLQQIWSKPSANDKFA